MAKNQGQLNFGINFNVNTASLNQVKNALKNLREMSKEQIKAAGGDIIDSSPKGMKNSWQTNLGNMRKELDKITAAFEKTFNPKLGTIELNKFNKELGAVGLNAEQAFTIINSFGKNGKATLLDMASGMIAVDRVGKQTNETLKKLSDTMMNTIRWSITSTAINTVTGAIQQAYHYAVDLDKSLNDIMIVTDKSSREMEKFAKSANKAAKELGSSTKDYSDASLIYYQQGLSDREVASRTETTIKAAAITGQSAEQVSEQLTAVWNGYKVSAEESELYIDKLSAVAASTAADLEELSVGMSKVASAASIMGVDVDQLNAQLATIVSVTREAPESIGTALKTVYARMSDIEAGLDTETSLGEYTSQMAQMGINVLDANGKLRDMGDVVEEIGNNWSTLNREQQVSLAQSIAGTRQYSRMMALFDNWDMYQEAMTTSIESAGTLSKQHIKYLDSIEAHQNKLKASAEGLYDTIFDSDQIKGVYDVLTGLVEGVNGLVKGLGGMPGILSVIGVFITKFGRQGLQNLITQNSQNRLQQEIYKAQIKNGKVAIETLKQQVSGNGELSEDLDNILKLEQKIYDNANNLSDEQWNALQEGARSYVKNIEEVIEAEKQLKQTQSDIVNLENQVTEATGGNLNKLKFQLGSEKFNLTSQEGIETFKKSKQYKDLLSRKNVQDNKTGDKKPLSDSEKQKLKFFEKIIPLMEEYLKKQEEEIKQTKELEGIKAKQSKTNKDLLSGLEDQLKFAEISGIITDIADSFSMVAFSSSMAAGSVQSFSSVINDSNAGVSDWIGAFGGAVGVLGFFAAQLMRASKGLQKVKQDNLKGIPAWSAYWAAATLGISIVITGLTTLFSILGEVEQAKIDEANATIEKERETQKEIKANQKLEESYLNLYEAYKKTGENKNEMVNAADSVIEALQSEELQALREAEAYELLAQRIREKQAAQQDDIIKSATSEKNAAATKLGTLRSGKVSGIADFTFWNNLAGPNAAKYKGDSINVGSQQDENNVINSKIIEDIFEGDPVFKGKDNDGTLVFKPLEDMSADELANFYNKLTSATSHDNWKPEGRLNNNIQQILNDEDLAAVSDYISANKTQSKETARKSIQNKKYDSSTNFDTFEADREALIKQIQDEQGIDYDQAAAQVNSLYSEIGGDAAQLNQRKLWLIGKQKEVEENNLKLGFNLNDIDLGLDKLDEVEFNALKTLDLTEISDSNPLDEAIKKQVQKIRDEAWAGLSEERLAALDKQLTRLEKVGNGKNLKEQVEVLLKQTEILKDTAEVAQNTFGDKIQNFFKDASKNGLLGQLGDAINQLIADGNWEELRSRIEGLTTNNEDARQSLLDNVTAMMTASNDLADIEKQIFENEEAYYEKRIESLEKVGEAYEKQIDYLEGINSLLDHQRSLIELIHGENAAGELANYFGASLSNTQAISESYRQSLEDWTKQRNRTDTTEEEKALIEEKWKEAADAYASSIVEIANIAKEQYSNAVEALIQNFNQSLLPSNRTTAGLSEEWDWVKKQHSDYLSPLDRAFGIDEIRANYQTAINDSSNIKAQQKINDLMQEQLDILESQDKLSQYDLDRANKKLEILQAEIALQEAQDAKTQMRLTRGADGTYSYQYVADESAINKAQENLKKANQSLYQLDIEAYQENLDEFYSLYQEYQDKMREYAEDGKITEEEKSMLDRYEVELAELAEKNGTIQTNLQDAIKDSAKVLGEDAQEMVGKMQSVMNTGMQQLIKKFGEDNGVVAQKFDGLITQIENKGKEAFDEENGTVTKAFKNLNDLLIGENGVIPNYQKLADKFASDASTYSTQASEVSTLAGSYKTLADNIQLTIEKIISLKDVSQTPPSSGGTVDNSGGDLQPTFAWNGWINSKQNSLTNDIAVEVKSRGTSYTIYDADGNAIEINNDELNNHHFHLHGNPDGNGIQSYTFNGQTYAKGTMLKTNGSTGQISGLVSYGGTYYVPLANLNQLNGRAWYEFDTGGYTGDWHSSEGRLAMLHEKELVLKKEDTTNFLDALEILRSLNLSMFNNLTNLNTVRTPSVVDSLSSVTPIEQNVTIHAEFPDATDAQEIKEAFEELVNLATQRAFEK